MAKADHIFVRRAAGAYEHHGIDLGDGRVVHYMGDNLSKRKARIRIDRKSDFGEGRTIHIRKYGKCFSAEEVIQRAMSKLGQKGYKLFGNNCEHFACWCKTGENKSEQVKDKITGMAGSVGLTATATGSMAIVSGVGAAAGMSGAGIMSGLATTGSIVGGGAVAGLGVLGATPALLGTVAMRKILADDEALPSAERSARTVGRTASATGAIAGTAGAIGAISSAGTIAGVSGAGISSGLAAIGSIVGGGMAAGTAITIAAPAMTAAALGYSVYKAWKWLGD